MHCLIRITGEWLNFFQANLGSLEETLWVYLSSCHWQLKYSCWFQHTPVHLIVKQTTFQHYFPCCMKHHAGDQLSLLCRQRSDVTKNLTQSFSPVLRKEMFIICCIWRTVTTVDKVSISLRVEEGGGGLSVGTSFKKCPFMDWTVQSLAWSLGNHAEYQKKGTC